MKKKEIKLESTNEEDENITYTTYNIEYDGFDVRALRTQRFNSNIGEMEDSIEIEHTAKKLTEKDKEEISDFIYNQK